MSLDDDGGSWDELAEKAGITLIPSQPGDQFEMETDLTIYWPLVRHWWEPEKPMKEPRVRRE